MVHGIEDTKNKKKHKKKSRIEKNIEDAKHLSEAGRLIGNGIGKSLKPKKKNKK
jgi:hypothetical protein